MIDRCPVCAAECQARYDFCPECGAACWLDPEEARAELFARLRIESEAAQTDELSKIEYLLEALEDALERGELAHSAYGLLARRYLARARELGLKPSEKGEAAAAAASEGTATLAVRATDGATQPSQPATGPVPPPRPFLQLEHAGAPPLPAPLPPPRTPRPPSRLVVAAGSIPWTVWVALIGALLVIAAAAGFAIYAWPSLAPGIRLGILLALTAAFYGGGLWLRRRLPVIALSLLALGGALVLVDGWLLISASRLHSLWWWALLLAVGSAVHWGMAAWLRTRLFAASGAVAQIAWWWLLGTALFWPLSARAAILTTVGLLWTLAAHRLRRGKAQPVGQLLGLAGPALAGGAAVVAIVGGVVHPGWDAVIAAIVIAVTATAAIELQNVARGRWVREISAVALLPLPISLLALPSTGSLWTAMVLMVVSGAAGLLLSVWRGGILRAVAGLVTLLAAPPMPGIAGHGSAGAWIGAVASWLALGALAVVAGSLLPRMAPSRLGRGLSDACPVLSGGGWLVLVGASVLHIVALGVSEPLMAGQRPSAGALTLLASEAAAAWLISSAVRSRVERLAAAEVGRPKVFLLTAAGLAGYAYSQFAAVLAVHWIAPGAGHVWYSFVMLGLAAAWSQARSLALRRLLDISSRVATWMFGFSSIGSALFALAPALFRSPYPGLGYVLLAALAAALWGLEAGRFREHVFVAAASVAASVTIYLASWGIGSRAAAGLATAIAALVLVPLPTLLRVGETRSRTLWTTPALATGVAAVATLAPRPALATAGLLALAAAAATAHLVDRAPSLSLWGQRPAETNSWWARWPADAGAALAALAVFVALVPIAHQAGLLGLAVAWGVAAVGSFVFEVWARTRAKLARETGALVFLPLLAWALVGLGRHAPDWTAAAGLASALAVLAFAWWRGGHVRVVVGSMLLAVELPVVLVHASGVTSGNEAALVLGTELLLGLCYLCFSLWVRTAIGLEQRFKGVQDLRRVFGVGAWLLMSVAAAGLAPALELSWGSSGPPVSLPLLSGLTLVVWLFAGAVRWRMEARHRPQPEPGTPVRTRDVAPAIVSYTLSLYLASVIERVARPDSSLAWIAAAILVAGIVWSHLRRPARRVLGCPEPVVEVMWVATSGLLAMLVLLVALGRHSPDYASGAVFTIAGLAWLAETLRFGRLHYLPVASAALSGAAGLFVWRASSGVTGGLAASVAGAVLALSPLALSPLVQHRKAEWRLWWSLGAALAAAAGAIGAFFALMSATLGLAALAAAFAGPALLGLPAFAGLSAFVAFAAICTLESWTGANAWVGTVVAIVAAAAMLAPAIVRRGRPQPTSGSAWSLALVGALSLAGVMIATAIAGFESTPPAWLSGGDWSVAVLLCALAAYCAGWSLSAHSKWGLAAGPVILLAGLLMFLRAAGVGIPEAYFAVAALWCGVVAWRLSRRRRYRHLTNLVDIVALALGLGGPAILMMAAGIRISSTSHAIWLICLAAAMVGSGVGFRVRLYFGFGLGGVVLAAFWLTSSHLSAIPGVVAIVAVVGGALIALGAVGERRRARLTQAARNAFAGWR